ncbi:hypothetical protein FA09DRAFT_213457 [Tilletiopsis washingtonensis]|uniref:Uncharacterized protein n=1 Tax=Tilletiopsis washingtonensis TaxID=58919 RepID=A0A316ZDM5_9BASI|nr:hypothetical protein FA09DRAFT_213457 [Tilletiopsis washingtonensis]PWN99629.1 hypothetical protein FA09DRAFT_213457 [Tilletiopsis washingtonensis]
MTTPAPARVSSPTLSGVSTNSDSSLSIIECDAPAPREDVRQAGHRCPHCGASRNAAQGMQRPSPQPMHHAAPPSPPAPRAPHGHGLPPPPHAHRSSHLHHHGARGRHEHRHEPRADEPCARSQGGPDHGARGCGHPHGRGRGHGRMSAHPHHHQRGPPFSPHDTAAHWPTHDMRHLFAALHAHGPFHRHAHHAPASHGPHHGAHLHRPSPPPFPPHLFFGEGWHGPVHLAPHHPCAPHGEEGCRRPSRGHGGPHFAQRGYHGQDSPHGHRGHAHRHLAACM